MNITALWLRIACGTFLACYLLNPKGALAEGPTPSTWVSTTDALYPSCREVSKDEKTACVIRSLEARAHTKLQAITSLLSSEGKPGIVVFTGDGENTLTINGLDKIHAKNAYVTLLQDGNLLWANAYGGSSNMMGRIPTDYPFRIPLSTCCYQRGGYGQAVSWWTEPSGGRPSGILPGLHWNGG